MLVSFLHSLVPDTSTNSNMVATPLVQCGMTVRVAKHSKTPRVASEGQIVASRGLPIDLYASDVHRRYWQWEPSGQSVVYVQTGNHREQRACPGNLSWAQ